MRVVADLGNSRLKVARIDRAEPVGVVSLDVDPVDAWAGALRSAGLLSASSEWAVCHVNPAAAASLRTLLAQHGIHSIHWFHSAADVPVACRLSEPGRAGADRALAVLAATRRFPRRALRVVLCGTAITVERVDAELGWQGGAIGPGLRPSIQALASVTAQLPTFDPPLGSVPGWGTDTLSALHAGVIWGLVGATREILTQQRGQDDIEPKVVWAGGDAHWLAPLVEGAGALVIPHLVLEGLAMTFPED